MPVSGFVVIISPGAPIGSVGVAVRSGASCASRSRRWTRSTNSARREHEDHDAEGPPHGGHDTPHQSRMNSPITCAVWTTLGRYTRSPTPWAASAYGPKHTAGMPPT